MGAWRSSGQIDAKYDNAQIAHVETPLQSRIALAGSPHSSNSHNLYESYNSCSTSVTLFQFRNQQNDYMAPAQREPVAITYTHNWVL